MFLCESQPPTKLPFGLDRIERYFDLEELDRVVYASCRLAADSPVALYAFMQRYAHFNGFAGSCVARLASAIGLSRDLFRDSACLSVDKSDRGLNIAARIFAAAVDEHADGKQHGLSHRALAQATLKAIGDYAGLSAIDRNDRSQVPTWLNDLVTETLAGYQGTPGDVGELFRATGFHCASELLADREYGIIDGVIRHERKGTGFAEYMREHGNKVEHDGYSVSMWYWIAAHGHFEGHGVEQDHFEEALRAINQAIATRSEPFDVLTGWVLDGFASFVDIQQRLFRAIAAECVAWEKLPTQTTIV